MAQTLPPAPPGGRGMQGTRVLFGCGLSIMDEACGPRPGELHCRQCDVEAVTDDQVLPMYILLPQRAWAGDPHGASGRRRGHRAAARCTSTRKPAALGRALARARGHRSQPHPQIQCCSPSRLVYCICRFRRNTSRLSSTPFSSMSPPALLDPLSSATTAARSTCGAAAPTGWRSAACWRTRCGLARKNANTERGRNQGKRDWASVPTAGHQTARGASKQGALFPPGVA